MQHASRFRPLTWRLDLCPISKVDYFLGHPICHNGGPRDERQATTAGYRIMKLSLSATFSAIVAALGALPVEVDARPWTVERFKGCIEVELGDDLSVAQKIESLECLRNDSVTLRGDGPVSISADRFVVANRSRDESNWNFSIILLGRYTRLRGGLIDDRGGSTTIDRIRLRLGSQVFDLAPVESKTKFVGCTAARRILGTLTTLCDYHAVAIGWIPEPAIASARNVQLSMPHATVTFRAFMNDGVEFDGELPLAEIVAVAEMADAIN